MKWKNIDFKNNLIYIETSKSGVGDYIPMNSTVKETLKSLSPIYEKRDEKTVVSGYIFRGKEGKPLKYIRSAIDR